MCQRLTKHIKKPWLLFSGTLSARPTCDTTMPFILICQLTQGIIEHLLCIMCCEMFCQSLKISKANGLYGSLTHCFISGTACLLGRSWVRAICKHIPVTSQGPARDRRACHPSLFPTPGSHLHRPVAAATLGHCRWPTQPG